MSEELIKEFETKFKEIKTELKFKTSLDQISKITPIRDYVLKDGFIQTELIRSINRSIIENMHNWTGYLHSLVLPNPSSLVSMNEASFFTEAEKKEFLDLIKDSMILSSRNSLMSLKLNKKEDAKLLDDLTIFWEKRLNPKLQEVMNKVNKSWQEKK